MWGWVATGALVLALVGYKATTATMKLRAGKLPTPLAGDPLHATLLYLKTIWPALTFGVLIAAALRTLVPPSALTKLFSRGALRGQLAASATATPLMLCSCCAAPLFVGVYERTRKVGPALALLLGAPSLNLAAIAFTFLVFGPKLGAARVLMALVAVVLSTALVARLVKLPSLAPIPETTADDAPPTPGGFARSLLHVALRTVPLIVIGVVVSSVLAERIHPSTLGAGHGPLVAILVAATIAVPLALPTFFELPFALALLGAGMPAGVAAAVLFAGPAINLPSLFTVARASSWRVAAGVALAVWSIAVAGGLAVHALG
jgi:uncharacterized membrane protein YraQ (UPF0718 family)